MQMAQVKLAGQRTAARQASKSRIDGKSVVLDTEAGRSADVDADTDMTRHHLRRKNPARHENHPQRCARCWSSLLFEHKLVLEPD